MEASSNTEIIPDTSFTQAEEAQLVRLLGKVAKDGYRWPTERCMRAGHKVISYWAPELVITCWQGEQIQILLARYEGGVEEFRGMWHIPGGYNLWSEATIQETCSRLALREIGVDVNYLRTLPDPHKWLPGEHPYGRPLSLYVECFIKGQFKSTEKVRFFPVNQLPEPMVGPHLHFVKRHFRHAIKRART